MGIAAYNRGSRVVTRGILQDHGRWQQPIAPRPRPATWGSKSRERALAHARRVVSGRRRYGLPDPSLDVLAGAVEDVARVSARVALEAAQRVLAEIAETGPPRFASQAPGR